MTEMIRALVSRPESVRVETREPDEGTLVFRVFCDREDVGKVLGKRGSTIDCIRGYFIKVCAQYGIRKVVIDIVD